MAQIPNIENETDYNYALGLCYVLMCAKPGSLEEKELDIISKMIENMKKNIFQLNK